MREVIVWPFRVWLVAISLGLAILISVGVVLSDAELLFALILTLLAILIVGYQSRLIIEANQDFLKVGRANIESKFIGKVEILDEAAMKHERGAGLNPSAFLAIRFWVKGGAKIYLNDRRDPTPYWLVSTRHPEKISAALKNV